MNYTNSTLINYVRLSPNNSGQRNQPIQKITIHHMAGDLTIEQCGAIFAPPSRQCSSNYGIGSDGRIGMYCEEKNRSWCSSSNWNDQRAITIEVANDSGAPNWTISDKAMESLINLCVDICKRNNIEKLEYTGDRDGSLTVHRMFASTLCPGPYIMSKIPYITSEVNQRLHENNVVVDAPKDKTLYRVRKSWGDANSQIGAYSVLDNAKKVCKDGYSVFDENGNMVYSYTENKKSIDEIVKEVIAGKWGNGAERKTRLTKAGYDYGTIQREVNKHFK